MFLQRNKRLLIGVGAVAILWTVLYYTLVAPEWAKAKENRESADTRKAAWEEYTTNKKGKDLAEKSTETNKYEYLTRKEAEKKLTANRARIEEKFTDLQKIEFGNRETLKPFSVIAAGKGGDPKSLLNEKVKQAVSRANGILKAPITPEKISNDFENADDANNLLRVALVEAFLTAARDAKVEQIMQIVHFSPAPIAVPEEEKGDDIPADEPKKKKKSDKDKDKEKEEEKPKVDKLIQFPMKVQLRVPERFSDQVMLELEKPTPEKQKPGDEPRGFFSIRGFHISVRENSPQLVEMTVQVSALLRESEVKAMRITIKDPRNGGGRRPNDDDPFQ